MKKTKKIEKIEMYARFAHVVAQKEGAPLRIQAVTDNGKLITVACTAPIYKQVLGERRGEKGNKFSLGLRRLMHVKFRAHLDETGTIQALDIIPNRMFTSGAAPRVAGENGRRGFDIHLDEEIDGYDIWTEDTKDGSRVRVAYAGLDERTLCELLDALRAADWKGKKTMTLLEHRFERIDEATIRCRPVKETTYFT